MDSLITKVFICHSANVYFTSHNELEKLLGPEEIFIFLSGCTFRVEMCLNVNFKLPKLILVTQVTTFHC